MPLRCCYIVSRLAGIALLAAGITARPSPSQAQTSPYTAWQHKALLIHHFAKLTEWPKDAFADEQAPFVLGILGKDPFGKDIEVINGKPVKGHKILVKHFASVQEVKGCHLLFISSSETNKLPEILKALEHSSVLTTAEAEGFIEQNGMINLVAEQKTPGSQKFDFDINAAAAAKAHLKLDTYLLKLARKVKS